MASLRTCRACLEALPSRLSLSPVCGGTRPTRMTAAVSRSRTGGASRALHGTSACPRASSAPDSNSSGAGAAPTPRPASRGSPAPHGGVAGGAQPLSGGGQSTMENIKGVLGAAFGRFAGSYRVYGATEGVYKFCASQADYTMSKEERKAGTLRKTAEGEEIGVGKGVWHDDLGFPPTFNTWSQVTMLHMYLLVVRLRCLETEDFKTWQTQLVDHFFHDAEDRMDLHHDVTSRAMRQRYLKDLFLVWRGLILSYDEGIAKGDAELAAAVWRNLFKAQEDVDFRKVAAVVGWMRLVLQKLERMDDELLPFRVKDAFNWGVGDEFVTVDLPSPPLRALLAGTGKKGDGAKAAAAAAAAAAS